jgi:hypothetical protein
MDFNLYKNSSRQLAIHNKKKTVWCRKSNGLYGWKVGPQTSGNPKENKHTYKPKAKSKGNKIWQANFSTKNMATHPQYCCGGGEVRLGMEEGLQS